MSCVTSGESSYAFAIVVRGIGVRGVARNASNTTIARRVQDGDYRKNLKQWHSHGVRDPTTDRMAAFLRPDSYWNSMKDLACFIVRTAGTWTSGHPSDTFQLFETAKNRVSEMDKDISFEELIRTAFARAGMSIREKTQAKREQWLRTKYTATPDVFALQTSTVKVRARDYALSGTRSLQFSRKLSAGK
jgi:hypothetical protein